MQMDFKKTILWAIFSMSGLMLYNNWQVHEGNPSMFGGNPVNSVVVPDKAAVSKVDIPSPIQGAGIAAPTDAPKVNLGAIETAEKFVLKNDVLSIQISANGGNVIDAKLLKELTAEKEPVELFQYTPNHKYFARSGLIALGNADLPNHTSTFKLLDSGRDASGRPFIILASEYSLLFFLRPPSKGGAV
jgi:YidC/Oxa1 family membrane protein insertase